MRGRGWRGQREALQSEKHTILLRTVTAWSCPLKHFLSTCPSVVQSCILHVIQCKDKFAISILILVQPLATIGAKANSDLECSYLCRVEAHVVWYCQ